MPKKQNYDAKIDFALPGEHKAALNKLASALGRDISYLMRQAVRDLLTANKMLPKEIA